MAPNVSMGGVKGSFRGGPRARGMSEHGGALDLTQSMRRKKAIDRWKKAKSILVAIIRWKKLQSEI